MEDRAHDPRFGRRVSTGLAVAVVLTLTLGLGAAAAVFTAADTVFFAALPFADPGRLVRLESTFKGAPFSLSQMDFADWRRQSTAFTAASVFGNLGFNLEQGLQSRRLWGELVNSGYFELLGLRPALGRFFIPEEDARPFERYVVVLGHDLWKSAFGGDPGVVGRTVRLNGGHYTVVGVAPPGFHGLSDQASLWIPSMVPTLRDSLIVRRERWIRSAVARLKPGVTIAQAQAEMDRIAAGLARQFPNMNQGIGAAVTPLGSAWVGPLRKGVLTLVAGALLALLFAGFNASLLFARADVEPSARRRQGLLLALIAGLLALVLAGWITRTLLAESGAGLPSFYRFTVRPGVIVVTLGLAVLAGLALRRAPRAGRGTVVLVQAALALLLLADTALVAKRFHAFTGRDLGFHPADVLTYRMDLKGPQYMDNEVVSRILREKYIPRISAVPGVRQVALSNPTMPTDAFSGAYITIEDHASKAPDGTYVVLWHSVGPGYFETLGIPILEGRGFNLQDTNTAAVIVSKALADQQWPGQNPLGKRLKQDARGVTTEPWMTVVGVVGEVLHQGLRDQKSPAPDMYMSVLEFPLRLPLTINFLVRPQPGVSTRELTAALERVMTAIDPEVPAYDMATLAERLDRQVAKPKFEVLLLGIFSALALCLTAIGLYAVRPEASAAPVVLAEPRPLGVGESR